MNRRTSISPCKHCGKKPGRRVRRRGLCSACYDDLTIRSQYAAQAADRSAPGAGQEFNGPAKLPRRPTAAAPGSRGKIAVLAQRAQGRLSLFHPADLIMPPDAWGWAVVCEGESLTAAGVVRLQGTA
jgi:hypothetical protein